MKNQNEIEKELIEEYLNEMGKKAVPNHPAFKNPVFPENIVKEFIRKSFEKGSLSTKEEVLKIIDNIKDYTCIDDYRKKLKQRLKEKEE